ncbi:hypothetical protein QQ054_30920 [Oscillatoria amoena NRMC-F 0135]|nr:hypothetical protein [Oscillatoria amoena NRMC-F 0135]
MKNVRVSGPVGCLLIIILWPVLILGLFGAALYFLIRTLWRGFWPGSSRPQSTAPISRDGVIDVEAVEVDEKPLRRDIMIEPPRNPEDKF